MLNLLARKPQNWRSQQKPGYPEANTQFKPIEEQSPPAPRTVCFPQICTTALGMVQEECDATAKHKTVGQGIAPLLPTVKEVFI